MGAIFEKSMYPNSAQEPSRRTIKCVLSLSAGWLLKTACVSAFVCALAQTNGVKAGSFEGAGGASIFAQAGRTQAVLFTEAEM